MIALFALAGAAIGGLLNHLIDRLPARASLTNPPPGCAACGRRMAPVDLVPIIGYLATRGRCPSCGAAVTLRRPVVEASTALLFAAVWLRFGPGWPVLVAAFYTAVLVVIFVIDLEHRLVLDRVSRPAMAAALAFAAARTLPGDPMGLAAISPPLLSALAGGLLGYVTLYIPWWLTKGGMGWGDVSMATLMGLMLGIPTIVAGLFWGFAAGGITAMLLLISGTRRRRDAVPYAPFLATGAWFALLFGQQAMAWYLGRF